MNVRIPKRGKTFIEKANLLKDAKTTEVLALGIRIGMYLLARAVNMDHHIANNRLIHTCALAKYIWETEFFNKDVEYAAECLLKANEKSMGIGWEEKADALCIKMMEENK